MLNIFWDKIFLALFLYPYVRKNDLPIKCVLHYLLPNVCLHKMCCSALGCAILLVRFSFFLMSFDLTKNVRFSETIYSQNAVLCKYNFLLNIRIGLNLFQGLYIWFSISAPPQVLTLSFDYKFTLTNHKTRS